jgi:dolichol-phosphate mannosyltransferase
MERSGSLPEQASRTYRSLAFLFIAVITGFRLGYCGLTNLANDEVYYWDWSRRLDWGYYEGSPAVAWLIRLTTSIFGQTEFGVRVASPILFALTSLLLFRLAVLMFRSERVGLWTVVVFNLTPAAFYLGWSMYLDPLFLFAWALAMYACWRAVEEGGMHWWLLLGLAVAVGFLSKYSMAMFVPCAGLFLLMSRPHRRWLLRPQPYAALALAALLVLPNIVWNAQHEWISFRFSVASRLPTSGGSPDVAAFWIEQALVNSPLVLVGCFAALLCVAFVPRYWRQPQVKMLFCVSAPVLGFFVLDSFFHLIFMNWPLPGYVGAYVLLAFLLCSWTAAERPVAARVGAAAAAGVGVVVELAMCILILFPFAPLALGLPVIPQAIQQTDKYAGWDSLGRQVDDVRDSMRSGGTPFVAANSWALTSYLSFYCRGRPRSFCLFDGRGSQYDIWDDREKLAGRDAVLVVWGFSAPTYLRVLQSSFDRIGQARVLVQRRPGHPEHVMRAFCIVPCYGFKPPPGVDNAPLMR